jgi:hypothetical protein
MTTSQIVGLALVASALVDAVLTFKVIGPRIPDEGRRRIVTLSMLASCAGIVALGAALLAGALG